MLFLKASCKPLNRVHLLNWYLSSYLTAKVYILNMVSNMSNYYNNVYICFSIDRAMNIPCVSVRGFAKGFCYELGTELTINSKIDHAWNLVRVNDEWHPLDCVWGAGFLTKQKKFVQKLDEFWFLTDPSKFLPRHFPFSNGWVPVVTHSRTLTSCYYQ